MHQPIDCKLHAYRTDENKRMVEIHAELCNIYSFSACMYGYCKYASDMGVISLTTLDLPYI